MAEKLSIETVASCTFGVKAGAFDSKEQTEFCQKSYGLFTHNWVDFLYMLAMQGGARFNWEKILTKIIYNKE